MQLRSYTLYSVYLVWLNLLNAGEFLHGIDFFWNGIQALSEKKNHSS